MWNNQEHAKPDVGRDFFLLPRSFWSHACLLKTNSEDQKKPQPRSTTFGTRTGRVGLHLVMEHGVKILSLLSMWKPRSHLCDAMHRPPYYSARRTARRQLRCLWEQSQDLCTVLCSMVGSYLLGSVLGEEQLQHMPPHALYLLKACFSDSLMNEIAVKNKCLIVLSSPAWHEGGISVHYIKDTLDTKWSIPPS